MAGRTSSWRDGVVSLGGGLLFIVSLLYGGSRYVTDFESPRPAGGAGAAAFDLLLFSAFALHHSLFARTGLKRHVEALVSPALERSVYVWIASALFIGVCAAWRPVGGTVWTMPMPWAALGTALQIAGLIVTVIASRQLDVLFLAGIRQALGQPSATHDHVVRDGMYALVRHPLYFGWALMVFPAPHMTATRLVFAMVSTFYLAIAIPFEERALRRAFGAEYDAYVTHVRWRMMPGVY